MSRIPPEPVIPVIKTLYNDARVTSGELTLSDDATNYDILVFKLKTNAQYKYEIVVEPIAGQEFFFNVAVYNASGLQTEPYYYRNVNLVKILSNNTKKISIDTSYNNGNLVVGIVAVYGIKLVGSIT